MTADSPSTADGPRLVPLALRTRVLASIRAGLSAVGVLAAVLVGARSDAAILGWAFGAVLVSIILAGDRRGRRDVVPEPLPRGARQESAREIARTDVFPSTVGVALMTVVALAFNAVLAGLMAGILGGMALMTIVYGVRVAIEERKLGGSLLLERGTMRLFLRTAPPR